MYDNMWTVTIAPFSLWLILVLSTILVMIFVIEVVEAVNVDGYHCGVYFVVYAYQCGCCFGGTLFYMTICGRLPLLLSLVFNIGCDNNPCFDIGY